MEIVINKENFPELTVRVSNLTENGLRWAFIKGFQDDDPICLPRWMYKDKADFDYKDFYKIVKEEELEITEMTDKDDNVILKDDGTPILCIKRHDNLYEGCEAMEWD